jgi:hypothetical protein
LRLKSNHILSLEKGWLLFIAALKHIAQSGNEGGLETFSAPAWIEPERSKSSHS